MRLLGVPCVPVALNSGVYWTGFLKKPGTIVLEFLEPIPPGLKREAFMALLESRIETRDQPAVCHDGARTDAQCGPCTGLLRRAEDRDAGAAQEGAPALPIISLPRAAASIAARPPVCRQFLCGWRLFEEMGDDWRPDLSGVLALRKAPDELPPAWRTAPYGVHLVILGGEAAMLAPRFICGYDGGAHGARHSRSFSRRPRPTSCSMSMWKRTPIPSSSEERLTELYALLHAARLGTQPVSDGSSFFIGCRSTASARNF